MPDDLYDRDILLWSEQQAGLLRRLAVGERVNAAMDWPNLIEEVEDLGRAELHACESLLQQAMFHLIKLHGGADQPAAHWRAEILGFLAGAGRRFTPAMRGRIDLEQLWKLARRQAEALGEGLVSPVVCPWGLEALLAEPPHLDELLRCLD